MQSDYQWRVVWEKAYCLSISQLDVDVEVEDDSSSFNTHASSPCIWLRFSNTIFKFRLRWSTCCCSGEVAGGKVLSKLQLLGISDDMISYYS